MLVSDDRCRRWREFGHKGWRYTAQPPSTLGGGAVSGQRLTIVSATVRGGSYPGRRWPDQPRWPARVSQVGRDERGDHVQTNVSTQNREQSEDGVPPGDQAHDGQQAIEDREPAGVHASAMGCSASVVEGAAPGPTGLPRPLRRGGGQPIRSGSGPRWSKRGPNATHAHDALVDPGSRSAFFNGLGHSRRSAAVIGSDLSTWPELAFTLLGPAPGSMDESGQRYPFVNPISLQPISKTVVGTLEYLAEVERIRSIGRASC
jgi:hypothetical protein